MAAVTSFLNDVAALAKSGTDLLRNAQVFPMSAHSLPTQGMPAFAKLFQLLWMTFPAFIWENHGFRFIGGLMVGVAGDAAGGTLRILSQFVYDPVEGRFIHLLMRMIRAKVAVSAGLWLIGRFD